MTRFFDPSMLARTYRDPVAQIGLLVDLIPVYAVIVLGWGAAPLVLLYWLENIVIGAVALGRMTVSSMNRHPAGLIGVLFLGPFFVLHYGMFCFAHGTFLVEMADGLSSRSNGDFLAPVPLINEALSAGPHMLSFILIIASWQAVLFGYDFIWKRAYLATNPGAEMAAPYGRIIVLHVALFAGMFLAIALGDPMIGVLGLILLRAVWGVFLSVRRRLRLDGGAPAAG